MDGFTRRKEQSKEEIRKAAWQLFSQFGVEKVSMNDIARKAGVSHATIYNNFGSKAVLVQEYVTDMVDQLMGSAEEIANLEKPFAQKMAAFFQFITGMMANKPAVDNPFFAGSIDLHNDPEIARIRDAAQEKMTQLIMELVAEGKRQNQVNRDYSDEALAIYFGMFMDMFVNPANRHRFHENPGLIAELGSLMLAGLAR